MTDTVDSGSGVGKIATGIPGFDIIAGILSGMHTFADGAEDGTRESASSQAGKA
jgi:hypothetical protein